jgi:hypothetical protein
MVWSPFSAHVAKIWDEGSVNLRAARTETVHPTRHPALAAPIGLW